MSKNLASLHCLVGMHGNKILEPTCLLFFHNRLIQSFGIGLFFLIIALLFIFEVILIKSFYTVKEPFGLLLVEFIFQLLLELPTRHHHLTSLVELALSGLVELNIGYPLVEQGLGTFDHVAPEEALEVLFYFHLGLLHLLAFFRRQE